MNCKLIALALTLALPLGVSAAPKKEKKAKAEVAKVDTASVETFSYAIGMSNTQGLKMYLAQRMNVDTTYIADFLAGFGVTESNIADQRLRAYLAGVDIRQQVESGIIPQMNQQVSGNDTTQAIHHDLFIAGFKDGIMGHGALSADSANAIVQKNLEYYAERNMMEKYGEWKAENEKYLADNAKAKDVKVTESGLQYKVLTQGEGEVPTADQRVKVHYEGRLIDGTEFDSSIKRGQPATFGCTQVIKGWTEALTMMPVGSKWELYIPQELGYGTRETGKIKPFSTLVFTVELIEIVK